MWNVMLINEDGCQIDSANFYGEELTLDDIAELNWSLTSGDSICIDEENE